MRIQRNISFATYSKKLSFIAQHAPGIPKVLVGNRLHLAFRRQVAPAEAEEYAEKNAMGFFEVSAFRTLQFWFLSGVPISFFHISFRYHLSSTSTSVRALWSWREWH